MADLADDVERNVPGSTSSPFKPGDYGSVHDMSSSDDMSPLEEPRPGYALPHQHRIIPPSITGHGRLILAHRTVPYWVGACFVLGAFGWAVWCAIFIYSILRGHPDGWKGLIWNDW